MSANQGDDTAADRAAPPGTTGGPARRGTARPTMKAIADQVGVSIKSVSRVLNGEGGVSARTADRILTAAQELGFRPNELARGLRRGDRTQTIGIVLKHSSTRFYENLIRGVEDVAQRHGLLVITATSRSPDREKATLLALSSRRVDGLLIVPTGGADHSFLKPEQAVGIPLVFVDRPPTGLVADTVLTDDFGGGHAAVSHLLRHGHRRIGVVGAAAELHTVAERVRGYRAALDAYDVPADGELVRLDIEGTVAAAKATEALLALPEPPTALFALNNLCTIGVIRALRDRSRHNDVGLVGFDDFELADLLQPPVTVVAQDIVALGRLAAEQLLARINGAEGPHRVVTLPTKLIRRGSGEIPAAGRAPLPPGPG